MNTQANQSVSKSSHKPHVSKVESATGQSRNKTEAHTSQSQQESEGRISKLWFWIGILTLIIILLYWVFFIAVDFGVNQ